MMDFFQEYFLEPMGHYYTLYATVVYAILFVAAIYLTYKYILKKRIRIDKNFMFSLVPFILLGGTMRALEDAGFYYGYLFVSPGIYVTIFIITILSLITSLGLAKYFKKPYWHFLFGIGSVLLFYNIVQVLIIGVKNPQAFFMISGLMFVWSIIFFSISHFFPKYLSRINLVILLSHLLDASSSFVAVTFFNYREQHVVAGFLSNFGLWTLFPLKIVVVWLTLFAIDRYVKEKEFQIWLKIAVLLLGLALGTRNLLSVSMLV